MGLKELLKGVQGAAPALTPEEMAEVLRTTPEALAEFEESYRAAVESPSTEKGFFDLFDKKRKDAAGQKDGEGVEHALELGRRIGRELAAGTHALRFAGGRITPVEPMGGDALPELPPVGREDFERLPEEARPQLTARAARTDLAGGAAPAVLWFYREWTREEDPKRKAELYHMFRQGLDVQDLDPVLYAMLGTNPNAMGHWLPPLYEAVYAEGEPFFKIPDTVVARAPIALLQMTRLDWGSLTAGTKAAANEWARLVFGAKEDGDYFLKTGTYSSKFDFRNAHVKGGKEVAEIGEYLLFIQHSASMMASPLNRPCIYGVSTTNELAVREFVPAGGGAPTIYQGLPLRPEYRAFVDFDEGRVLSIVPYWDEAVMERRFEQEDDAGSPHMRHDAVAFRMAKGGLKKAYEANKGRVEGELGKVIRRTDLHGQWSVDVMQEGDEFWLIDMALAEDSAFYESVSEAERRPSVEDWIPKPLALPG